MAYHVIYHTRIGNRVINITERETWATRTGLIVVAVSSVVGLGNIRQFPFKTAQFDGASLLIACIVAMLGIGLLTILAEFIIGRKINLDIISAFKKLDYKKWRAVGAIDLFISFWILPYYSVIGDWVLRYIGGSLAGAYFTIPAEYFDQVSADMETFTLRAIFVTLAIGIVTASIEGDIEEATKLTAPNIVAILATLIVFAFTLPGTLVGYAYLLSLGFSALSESSAKIIPFAVRQALFSLSFGMGVMITYTPYVDGD